MQMSTHIIWRKDAYGALKALISRKYGQQSGLVEAIDQLEAKWLIACPLWVLGIGLIDVVRIELRAKSPRRLDLPSFWYMGLHLVLSGVLWGSIWVMIWQWVGRPNPSPASLTPPLFTGAMVVFLVGIWGSQRLSLAIDIQGAKALGWSWIGICKGGGVWAHWRTVGVVCMDGRQC